MVSCWPLEGPSLRKQAATVDPFTQEVTGLLLVGSRGDRAAYDKLVPLVYDELQPAGPSIHAPRTAGHTLQTTALVGEAYLRLIDQTKCGGKTAHTSCHCRGAERRILVD